MEYLDLTLPTAEENLALDEALLLEAEEGRSAEVLRFWELPTYAVVLGSSCRLQQEVRADACQGDGIPLLRRCTGGGSVLLGPGCLSYAVVLSMDPPPLRDVTHSYAYILERVRTALTPIAPGLVRAAASDLAVGDSKVSGNSQRRKSAYLLHHGTILYQFDAARMGRYLHQPERQPAYRRNRDHAGFVTNLDAPVAAIKAHLRSTWSAERIRAAWPEPLVRRLVDEKYANPAWTQRR
jgi:lipoate-protein ligase A